MRVWAVFTLTCAMRLVCAQNAPEVSAMNDPELAAWLLAEAKRQVEGCRKPASDGKTWIYTPDGSAHYNAHWTRDFCYMVEGFPEVFSEYDLRRGCEYLLEHQREDGCIPDRVDASGHAVYGPGPGTWKSGFGDRAADNGAFMAKLVGHYTRLTGKSDLFAANTDKLERGLALIPRGDHGLLYIDPAKPHSPYGFTDTIKKTGELLFSSLLLWEACGDMALMYGQIAQQDEAQRWRREGRRVKAGLQSLWDDQAGAFFAASRDCRQHDVWGSAYAVFIGVTTQEQTRKISRFLVSHYEQIVQRGYVRHIVEPEGWQATLVPVPVGRYQNGAFWATPTAWFCRAVAVTDRPRAEQTLRDLIRDFMAHGVNECVNDEYKNVPDYVASATLPLIACRDFGWLR